jgi:hypothetical protein
MNILFCNLEPWRADRFTNIVTPSFCGSAKAQTRFELGSYGAKSIIYLYILLLVYNFPGFMAPIGFGSIVEAKWSRHWLLAAPAFLVRTSLAN